MKIIFLDFDGVINSMKFAEELAAKFEAEGKSINLRHMIDPAAVSRLNHLIHETDAKVVVSSTWRKYFDLPTLRELLEAKGFQGDVIGITPDLSWEPLEIPWKRHERGLEIEKWIKDNQPDAIFVILDDDSDMGNLHHRFVQTSWVLGLLDEHIIKAKELLNSASHL